MRSRSRRCIGTSWTSCGYWCSRSSTCYDGGWGKAMTPVHKQPNYIGVFWWLVALTILEVGGIYLPIASLLIGILLIGLALSKASLVAMYFMHLKFESRTLGLIALTPLVLCVLLIVALLPDLTAIPHRSSEPPRGSSTPH